MIRRLLTALALMILIPLNARAQNLEVNLQAGDKDFDGPIRVPLQAPNGWKSGDVQVKLDGKAIIGQLTEPNFVTDTIKAAEGKVRKDLIIIAALPAGKSAALVVAPPTSEPSPDNSFAWTETKGEHTDLHYGKAPVMRYMHKTFDPSTPDARNKSYKVFHHLYDPSGNGKLVTNGGQTDPGTKDFLYPHHRGLMFAFNKCSYEGKSADTWHCTGDAHVEHQKTLFASAGPIMAEHRVLLTWHGPKNEVFAEEERQMTVYKVTGGTLVEFATRLTPKFAKVRLDGDPQHAGFQFRAHNDVAKKTAKETYYLRPDGKGKPGETRNWSGNKGPVNLPWNVLSFVLDGKRYSVEYIDSPTNPGEKRYSERDYGRFGCYFEYDLTPQNPLVLNHRIWLQEGEMTGEQAEKLREAFVNPPRVK